MCGGGTLLHTSRPSAMKMDEETILLDEMLVVSGEVKVGRVAVILSSLHIAASSSYGINAKPLHTEMFHALPVAGFIPAMSERFRYG